MITTTIEWNETIMVPLQSGEVLCALDDERGRRVIGAYYDAERDAFRPGEGSHEVLQGVRLWVSMPDFPDPR